MDDLHPEPVRTSARDGAQVLHLSGAVSVIAADTLLAAARASLAAGGSVAVDCERAEHLDASALQILLALRRALKRQGRELCLEAVPAPIAGSLALAGLQHEFPLSERTKDAR